VLHDQVLDDEPAHGQAKSVNRIEAQRLDEGVGIIRRGFDGAGDRSRRGADAALMNLVGAWA